MLKEIKFFNILFVTILLASLLTACKDDADIVLSDAAEIVKFQINDVEGVINETDISVILPNGTDLTNLTAEVSLSEHASIDPDPSTISDYSTPRKFSITSQDRSTTKTYSVVVTIAPIVPTEENPFPEGMFILRQLPQGYTLDFRHLSGDISKDIFQKANNGKNFGEMLISDVIPHENGYLIIGNMLNGSSGKILYTNLKLEVVKEESIEQANVVGNTHARIGNKIYYTNISNLVEFNQPTNKTYVIDIETNTLKKFSFNQVLQFYATSNNELYFTDLIRGLYKVSDINTLDAIKVEDFEDYTNSFVMDENDVLWSVYRTKFPENFIDVQAFGIGIFDYKLNLISYDTKSQKLTKGVSTKDINRESTLYAEDNVVYIITNQNTHHSNPKKELQKLFIEDNTVKLEPVYELPKTTSTNYSDMTYDKVIYSFGNNTINVFGGIDNSSLPSGEGSYYYDIDLGSGVISNKTNGSRRMFVRKAIK